MYADAAATQTPDIYLFHTPALRGMLKRLRLSFSLFSETFGAAAEQLNTCLRSEYCRTSGMPDYLLHSDYVACHAGCFQPGSVKSLGFAT